MSRTYSLSTNIAVTTVSTLLALSAVNFIEDGKWLSRNNDRAYSYTKTDVSYCIEACVKARVGHNEPTATFVDVADEHCRKTFASGVCYRTSPRNPLALYGYHPTAHEDRSFGFTKEDFSTATDNTKGG